MKKIIFFVAVIFAQIAHATVCEDRVTSVEREVERLSDSIMISDRAWHGAINNISLSEGYYPYGVLKACLTSCGGEELTYCDKVLIWLRARISRPIPYLIRKKQLKH